MKLITIIHHKLARLNSSNHIAEIDRIIATHSRLILKYFSPEIFKPTNLSCITKKLLGKYLATLKNKKENYNSLVFPIISYNIKRFIPLRRIYPLQIVGADSR